MKDKCYQIILFVSIFINIIFIMILLLNLIGNIYFEDTQEIYKWDYNGSSCFDNTNAECQDFLRLWDACQDYKNRLGVC